MPQISVIINVYNGAATLRETVDSVLSQSHADWELIVWDDCSTDESGKIIAQYRDPRIRYFLSEEQLPLGQARNLAMKMAKGEWIAFLDQDDIWLPRKLEQQISLITDSVGLIYGRTVRFYPDGRERDYDHAHEYEFLPEGDIFRRLFTESCFIAMSSAMFRHSAVEAIGGIPDSIRIIPDYYLYVAVTRRYKVRAVQQVVCRYRMHPDSMSHVTALAMHEEVLWLIDHWASELDAATVSLCRRRHQTLIALEEMRGQDTFGRGLGRLLSRGSVASQLARPFAYLFHVTRRALRAPYWRRLPKHSTV